MTDKPLPPWADEIPQGAFISYEPTYKVGEYFSRFHKDFFNFSPDEAAQFAQSGQNTPTTTEKHTNEESSVSHGTAAKCGMSYYYYDPTEHGFPKNRDYPVFVFMHGLSNALEGDVCINYAGAEFYSKEEYQNAVRGAYLLVPIANEYRDENGTVQNSWSDSYIKPVHHLICEFQEKHAGGHISKKVMFGNSRGATMCFKMVDAYTDFFNALIPIGTSDISDDATLDRYDKNNVWLFYATGKRDEFNDYKTLIAPRIPRLERMKHCFIFTPEWVYNGDHGIASINFGVEMGQHCLINPMHCNLMFDDGTPMQQSLPNGVTGWLAQMLKA